jgi:Oxidoreductase family, NAD-binding Rossmann fold
MSSDRTPGARARCAAPTAVPVSEARAAASRINGARSRGPKTPEGKARSARNALKHGLCAEKFLVLAVEGAAAFAALQAALLAELAPVGALQGVLAGRVVSAAWRLARADRMEAEVLERRRGHDGNLGLALIRDGNGTRSCQPVVRYRNAALAELTRCVRTLQALQAAVERFKAENDLLDTEEVSLSEQQLAAINSELVGARAELAAQRAKLQEVEALRGRGQLDAVAEVVASPVIIGAGNFARSVLLPQAARTAGLRFTGVATATGMSARHVADKYRFGYITTNYHQILDDPETDAVFIVTRHASHARIASDALRAGKAVFVEKPLACNLEQLTEVVDTMEATGGRLMVGFNRRFAPHVRQAKTSLEKRCTPLVALYRVNAGSVPGDSWLVGEKAGAGSSARSVTSSIPCSS